MKYYRQKASGRAGWLMPVISELWEAETVDHLRSGVRDSLANMAKPCLYQKNTKISLAWWLVPVIPAAQEAKAQESLEPQRRRLQ